MGSPLRVAIIGSGFSALSNACYLAKNGYHVDVFEKNILTPTKGLRVEESIIWPSILDWANKVENERKKSIIKVITLTF